MVKSKKTIIGVIIFLIAIISLGSFISYSKFGVINPFSTVNGLIQVMFTEKAYIEIQKYPKVIISKPNVSLQDYMQNKGF